MSTKEFLITLSMLLISILLLTATFFVWTKGIPEYKDIAQNQKIAANNPKEFVSKTNKNSRKNKSYSYKYSEK